MFYLLFQIYSQTSLRIVPFNQIINNPRLILVLKIFIFTDFSKDINFKNNLI
jgi:hypothetical protein